MLLQILQGLDWLRFAVVFGRDYLKLHTSSFNKQRQVKLSVKFFKLLICKFFGKLRRFHHKTVVQELLKRRF